MNLLAFALYDIKAGCYAVPFFMPHVAAAMRAVAELAQDRTTTVARYPSDYAIHSIGSFDDNTGLFSPQQPVTHGSVAALLEVYGVKTPPMPLFAGADQPVPNGRAGPKRQPVADLNGEVA